MSDATTYDAPTGGAESHPQLWGLIITYRRPDQLEVTLARIKEQSRAPEHLLVVDNGSDPAARRAAEAAGADYVDSGDNLGPAGGIALGMDRVLAQAGDDDWLVLFDDDDPPPRTDLLDELWGFAFACQAQDPMTAGVGLVGSRYDRNRGVFRRVPDEELHGAVPVDYIGGGRFPLFSSRAVRACGVFDRRFFFGFDDAEYGLRLRRAGYSLYAHGALWHEQRALSGRLNLDKLTLRTAEQASSWRRYYGVRGITRVARLYGTPLAAAYVSLGGGLRAALTLGSVRRPLREVILPLRGALDGLLGRGGRTVDPGSGEKTACP